MREQGFRDAFRERREATGISFRELGELVAEVMGRDTPFKASSVQEWAENAPRPEIVFAIERALSVPPGGLSRLLGYVPVVEEPKSVRDVIERDPDLDAGTRAVILSAYDAAVQHRRRT